jgi:hypothetical protein
MTAIPAPPVFHAGIGPAPMLIIWGALALAAVVYAGYLAVRDRDPLPVAACAGALVCALNEPIYDVLGKLVYARVPASYTAYTAFGRHIPWTLVVGYVPWVGLMPYILFRMMRNGVSRRRLHVIAIGLNVSVGLIEVANSLWLHDWRYYGGTSARGVLAGGLIQMSAMPLLCAFLFYAFADRFTGWRRAVLGIVLPAVSLPMVFAATSWPLYVSNYSHLSQPLRWAAAGTAVVLCVLAVFAVTYMSDRWHARALAVGGDPIDGANGSSDIDRALLTEPTASYS